MKGLIFICAMSLTSLAFAQNTKLQNCKIMEKLAINIMKARQADIPMSKLYEIDLAKNNPEMDKAIKQMIVDAYDMPSFSDPQIKAKMISDYGNKAFSYCIK